MRGCVLIVTLLSISVSNCAQDSIQKKWEFHGYLKDLNTIVFDKAFKNAAYTNLVHNRLNFKWRPSEKFTGAVEIRNRLYWGDQVQAVPQFGRQLRNDNEAVNLSTTWKISENSIFVSNVERLWGEYRRTKWNVKAGRQRVNWGTANIWNPNDIFNSYNFLDFDYEERPGCDALKMQYIINDFSNIEITTALTGQQYQTISAIRYFTNYQGYDLQLISGIFHKTFTAGFGWAGNIDEFGFRSEGQFFFGGEDSTTYANVTMELDYFLKKGWYINSAFLYNRTGLDAPVSDWSQVNFKITPTSLMPAKWNMLLGCSKEFTPLFSGSISTIYCPGARLLILYPSFKYSLLPDVDVDLVWQSLFAQQEHGFGDISHAVYLRLKWSF